MFSKSSRVEGRFGRHRARAGRLAVEGLEGRHLLAFSSLGFSPPQLSVSGYGPTEAAYGAPITLDVTVENLGASSINEPLNLMPGSASGADAPATTVQVFAAASPNANGNVLLIDTVQIPAIRQNSDFMTISTVNAPARQAGFPGLGGKIYLTFVVDNNQSVQQLSRSPNIYRDPNPLTIVQPLPDLQVVGFDIPATLQPGDVIVPTIRIANLGAVNPNLQGPVTVQLIASTNTTYGPGDAVVGSFTINSLPGLANVPTRGPVNLDANVIPPPNEITVTLPPIKLPTTPGFYYLGVKIDPNHNINQTYGPNASLSDLITVGPPNAFLPPANQVASSSGLPVFPAKPSALLTPIVITTTATAPVLFPSAPLPGNGTIGTPGANGGTGGTAPIVRAGSIAVARSAHVHVAAVKPAHQALKHKR